MKSIIVLFFVALSFIECKSPACNCYAQKSDKEFINEGDSIFHIHEISRQKLAIPVKSSVFFGAQLAFLDDQYYVVILTETKDLKFIGLGNNDTVKTISVKGKWPVHYNRRFSAFFLKDTLHVVDISRAMYYQCKLSFTEGLTISDSINIRPLLKNKNRFIAVKAMGKGINYNFPYLYLPYIRLGKKNSIEKNAILRVDCINKTAETIVSYPDCYHCSGIYERNLSLVTTYDASTVVVFDKDDELRKNNKEGELIQKAELVHSCKMIPFDMKKVKNLAYVNRELVLGEKNIALLNIQDKFFAVVKRYLKKSYDEKDKFGLYIFDNDLRQVYAGEINHSLSASAIWEYKNGFLLFSSNLSAVYYYEFNNLNNSDSQ